MTDDPQNPPAEDRWVEIALMVIGGAGSIVGLSVFLGLPTIAILAALAAAGWALVIPLLIMAKRQRSREREYREENRMLHDQITELSDERAEHRAIAAATSETARILATQVGFKVPQPRSRLEAEEKPALPRADPEEEQDDEV